MDKVEKWLKDLGASNRSRWLKLTETTLASNRLKTTRREGSKDRATSTVDPTVTRSTIRADVGVAIVLQTISRHLAEANLKSKRPFRALPLTPEHQQLRLQWYQARSMWNVTDWQKVVLRDKYRFVLGTDDNRPHTVLRHADRTAGVMVGGGHSL
ncbi:transposable element Tcb2 transposase [Trichonephila clavipes]|nr:transposable element Tcb2 transposase [Trichonephila clavipes]